MVIAILKQSSSVLETIFPKQWIVLQSFHYLHCFNLSFVRLVYFSNQVGWQVEVFKFYKTISHCFDIYATRSCHRLKTGNLRDFHLFKKDLW